MQDFARRLMSGASLALMAVGGLPAATARASNITVKSATVTSLNVPFPQEYDYILVTDDGQVTGDVVNQGFVGEPLGSPFGIEVQGAAGHPASIGGNITNEQVIRGSSARHGDGVLITGPYAALGGDILNHNGGDIDATARNATQDVAGIAILNGAHFDGAIHNSGVIHALATISGVRTVEAEGIRIDNSGPLFAHTDVNEAGGVINAIAKGLTSAHATVRGYDLQVHGDIGADLVNDGMIAVTASESRVVGGGAHATGARISNFGGTLNTNEFGEIENEGLIVVNAIGGGTTAAARTGARGVDLLIEGVRGTANAAEALLANGGEIGVKASANGFGVLAIATGAALEARDAFYATARATNNHLIVVTAVDHISAAITHATAYATADATAVGVRMHVGSAAFAANEFVNNGTVVVGAQASPLSRATALATGVSQAALSPRSGHNVITNAGEILAIASAKGGTDLAKAVGVKQDISFADNATNVLVNHGNMIARALASNVGHPATAEATGVLQLAYLVGVAHNTLENSGHIEASAKAIGITVDASGSAAAQAFGVNQYAQYANTAHNYLTNAGVIEAHAHGYATGTHAAAIVHAVGIFQHATGNFAKNRAVLNAGTVTAFASARAGGYANAVAAGFHQIATGTHAATNVGANQGTIRAFASAAALDTSAFAEAYGVSQYADAIVADNQFEMDGHISATARAEGHSALAIAFGIKQAAGGSSRATAVNFASGNSAITVKAFASGSTAKASAFGFHQMADAHILAKNTAIYGGTMIGSADAGGYTVARAYATGIHQDAEAATAFNDVENSGKIEAFATAEAAFVAQAHAYGIHQIAIGTAAAETTLGLAAANYATNGGYIRAKAYAVVHSGTATAVAAGIYQSARGTADGNVVRDEVINRGSVFATARAVASGGSHLVANATAAGVYEGFDAAGSAVAVAHNSAGIIVASAIATASNGNATAHASAIGIGIRGTAPKLDVDVMNSGHIYASASAHGSHAAALAFGIDIENRRSGGVVSGNIVNSGYIEAGAYAPQGKAIAAGIRVKADQFVGQIQNNRLIEAAATGVTASAAAIAVTNDGHAVGTGIGEIVNDGGELAAYANGKAGWAIELQNAPNEVDVTLEGNGTIYGNIGLQNADVVTIENGVTFFDGTINPDAIGNVGTLTVNNGATLYLPNAPSSIWGANAVINVNSYNQAGTLELDVDAANASGIATHNAQIHANNVNLMGGSVLINTQPGLYPNSITYQVVFGALGGTKWSSVALAPGGFIPTTSPFFTLAADYPSANEADVVLSRVSFNATAGLTPNQKGAGTGLEGGYSTSLTGAAQQFYQSILSLTGAQYPQTLDMLSGEEAGEMALINVNFARNFTDMLSAHTGLFGSANSMVASLSRPAPYQVASLSNTVPAPSDDSRMPDQLWGGGFGMWSNTKTTVSGPGYRLNDSGVAAGIDIYSDASSLFGIAGAYAPKTMIRFGSYGTPTTSCPSALPNACNPTGSVEGFEMGAYGRYNDDMGFYLAGNFAYGSYDNTTQRFISLPSLDSGFVDGKFTSTVWSVYGEGGYPVEVGSSLSLTPYVGVAYIGSNSGAYTETGALSGSGNTLADLRVTDASATSVQAYLGGQLSTSWDVGNGMTLIPNVKAAWTHEFESDIWNVDAYFSGIGPTSGFGPVTGGALSKNSAIVDANFSIEVASDVSTTFDYEGRFNGSDTNNFFFGRLNLTFP